MSEPTRDVIEMRLCETAFLALRPNQLYSFTVDPNCPECVTAAGSYPYAPCGDIRHRIEAAAKAIYALMPYEQSGTKPPWVELGNSHKQDEARGYARAALARDKFGPASKLEPIERDESYDRTYIPLPGGWEIQTKGKGSTFRLLDPTGFRLPINPQPYLFDLLERMGRDIHKACSGEPND